MGTTLAAAPRSLSARLMIAPVTRHRTVYAALVAALAAVVILVVLLSPSGEVRPKLPDPLESVLPAPGDAVVRQTAIEIDLPVGYRIDLYVDGEAVPTDEIGFTESTGRWTWQPGPGRSTERWEAGEHVVRIVWDRVAGGRPDPGEYEWAFRVQ